VNQISAFYGSVSHVSDRGEGANHSIVDVEDFVNRVLPHLDKPSDEIRQALDEYEGLVIERTRPAVFASRVACLHAHQWSKINFQSPLLSRRAMKLEFDETTL
jgi:hypothetical protein